MVMELDESGACRTGDGRPCMLVGHRYRYTYANGWEYEMYVKSGQVIDYRIHSGMVGGRWVKDQRVDIAEVVPGHFKISWTEPTGTSVVVDVVPDRRRLHGVIFFPRWVHEHPERTVLFQNEHLELMARYREEGPTYPIQVVSESATITSFEFVGTDDESVISGPPPSVDAGPASR
ncbi:phenolic acid decarboxylase [Nocardia niwae]|uniref:phenolic acid decarboxylase n=1 Tax=Nocardia niwae TaxID=626084 RepID=UPI003F4D2566